MFKNIIIRKYLLLFIGFFILKATSLQSQNRHTLQKVFDTIAECRDDSTKMSLNQKLYEEIGVLLQAPNSFDDPFLELQNLGKIYSDDRKVRIYTWSFPLEDKSYQYGGYIQYKKKNETVTTPLLFKSASVPKETDEISVKNWYGALYYKVFHVKKRRDNYYIAFGWSGFDAATDFKVIEPLDFDKQGNLSSFGKEVFNQSASTDNVNKQPTRSSKKSPYRIVLEYNSEGKVALDYDYANEKIVFDHLSPIEPTYTGIRAYYGPDFTYDAYELKKGIWYFEENIDARNQQ